jgi:tyrosinase
MIHGHTYYAIAGIHGLPQKVYDSAESPGAKGYCEHGTVLFPTWHRPYILLFEQAIIREAITIANELNDAASKNKCLEIANSLRMPYLDWESSFTAYQGLPDVFTRTSIDVTYPQDTTTTIPNPLRSYVLPVNLSKPISASDVFNPTAKPNYQIPETLTPFTPASYPTVRHPDNTYQSSVDALNLAVQRSCNLVLRPQLFAVMLQTDWAKFSNHFSDPVDGKIINNKEFYGHFASIEVIHDAFHDTVGGSGGHMTYPDGK